MKKLTPSHLALLTALLPLVACVRASHHSDAVPVFHEIEPNDTEFTPDDFGVLWPGDRFVIEGHIRDDELDPFDGFAFTAGQPLHVEFRLFADNPFADLGVCLFDPQLGTTVATYQTSANPELGGVDVFAGGFDFHLVVGSFFRSSSYSLEIQVFSLYAGASEAPAAAPERGAAGSGPRLEARGAAGTRDDEARFEGYLGRTPSEASEPEILLEEARWIAIDEDAGTIHTGKLFRTTDGTWMGIPPGVGE